MGLITILALSTTSAWVQSGGRHTLSWNTVDGGGGDCAGGAYVQQGGFLPAFQKSVGPALRLSILGGELKSSWPTQCTGFHLAVWQDQRNRSQWDIYGCRLARDGTRLDPSGIPIADWAGDDLSPAVAGGDNAFLVVWASQHNGNSDIYGKFVARTPFNLPNGNPPFPVCPDLFKQVAPAWVAPSSTTARCA